MMLCYRTLRSSHEPIFIGLTRAGCSKAVMPVPTFRGHSYLLVIVHVIPWNSSFPESDQNVHIIEVIPLMYTWLKLTVFF